MDACGVQKCLLPGSLHFGFGERVSLNLELNWTYWPSSSKDPFVQELQLRSALELFTWCEVLGMFNKHFTKSPLSPASEV